MAYYYFVVGWLDGVLVVCDGDVVEYFVGLILFCEFLFVLKCVKVVGVNVGLFEGDVVAFMVWQVDVVVGVLKVILRLI